MTYLKSGPPFWFKQRCPSETGNSSASLYVYNQKDACRFLPFVRHVNKVIEINAMITVRKFRQWSRVIHTTRNIIMAESSFHTTSDNKAEFRDLLQKAKNVVVLTGAGASAESGIPTFRGSGGLWRTFRAQDLATLEAFHRNPSLVWEFYSYRREVVLTKEPNKAHYAIAGFQKKLRDEGRSVTVITQNIDELHQRAGAEDVIELHGVCSFPWLQ